MAGRRTGVWMLRVSVAANNIRRGYQKLREALNLLHHRSVWRAVVGGAEFVEIEPAQGGGAAWNVHMHGLIELKPGEELNGPELGADWTQILAKLGVVGSVHAEEVTDPWERGRGSDQLFKGPVSHYVTKRPRKHWLGLDPTQKAALAEGLPGLRLASFFGVWRGVGRKRDRERGKELRRQRWAADRARRQSRWADPT